MVIRSHVKSKQPIQKGDKAVRIMAIGFLLNL
jgi:hypothetical protein